MDITKDSIDWSDEELAAAVETYLKMLALEKSGQPFNKAHENTWDSFFLASESVSDDFMEERADQIQQERESFDD